MNTKLKLIKKRPPGLVPKRPNIKSFDGGNVSVFVLRRNRSATAIPQTQGHGENVKRNTRAI